MDIFYIFNEAAYNLFTLNGYLLFFILMTAIMYCKFSNQGQLIIKPTPKLFSFFIIIYFILVLALYPSYYPSDKWNYHILFTKVANGDVLFTNKDIGYYIYVKFISELFPSPLFFFLITTFLYLLGYLYFSFTVCKQYGFILFIGFASSLGFASYGYNTLRAGLALSVLLVAFSRSFRGKRWIWIAAIAMSIHLSVVLPLFMFFILSYRRINNYKIGLLAWGTCLFISAYFGEGSYTYLEYLFPEVLNERISGLLVGDNNIYRAGFRIDFIVYSMFPIIIGMWYKKNFKDVFYDRIFNTYILSNAFFLLTVRVNFSDRIAYLSWFLLPFICLYPLLTKRIFLQQKKYILYVLSIILMINFTLWFSTTLS